MILLLLIAFLLELVAFFSFAALTLLFKMYVSVHIAVYVVLLIIVISFWAVYMSPKAPKKLRTVKYYFAKGIIYLIATVVIIDLINLFIGVAFVIIWLVDDLLILRLKPSDTEKLNVNVG